MFKIQASRRAPKLLLLLTVVATAVVFLAPAAQADSGLTIVTNTPADLSTVSPGDPISYSFTVTNIGPDAATSVVLSDSPPGDTTYVTDSARIDGADVPGDETPGLPNPFVAGVPLAAPLALNASVTFSFSAVVNSPLADGTQLVNTASAVDTDDSDPPATSQITQTVNSSPNLSVTKTSNPAENGTVEPDDVISYSVVVASVGTDTATAVTVTDATPTGTEYVPNTAELDGVNLNAATNPFEGGFLLGDMAGSPTGGPAPFHTIEFDVTVNNPWPNNSTISNTAAAGATNITGTTSDGANHTVSSTPGLTVDKTADPAESGPVEPGALITYTVVVANDPLATQTATNVELTDATPADTAYVAGSTTIDDGVTGPVAVPDNPADPLNPLEDGHDLGDLVPGDFYTLTFQVLVDTPLDNGTTLTNTAAVASDQGPATDDATHTVQSQSTLTFEKTATPAEGGPVTPGTTITYSMMVSNDAAANEVADELVLTDPAPAGTTYVGGSAKLDGTAIDGEQNPLEAGFALTDLGPGESATVTYDVQVDSPLASGTVVSNLASLSADNHPDLSDEATHTVDSSPVMKVEVDASPVAGSKVKSGQTIVYTINVSNDPAATEVLTGVTVDDAPPKGSTLNQARIDSAPPAPTATAAQGDEPAGQELVLVEDLSLTDTEIKQLNDSLWWELADGASLRSALLNHPNVMGNMVALNSQLLTEQPPGQPMWLFGLSVDELAALKAANPDISRVIEAALSDYYPNRMCFEHALAVYQVSLGLTPVISPELAAWRESVGLGEDGTAAWRSVSVEEGFLPATLPPAPTATAELTATSYEAPVPVGDMAPGQSRSVTLSIVVGKNASGDLTNSVSVAAANHPTVVATTTHVGPGDDDDSDDGGSAFGPGGDGSTTTTLDSTATGGEALAFTGLDVAKLALLAMSLLLAGWVLLSRGRILQQRAAAVSGRQPMYQVPTGRYAPRTWFFLPDRD